MNIDSTETIVETLKALRELAASQNETIEALGKRLEALESLSPHSPASIPLVEAEGMTKPVADSGLSVGTYNYVYVDED